MSIAHPIAGLSRPSDRCPHDLDSDERNDIGVYSAKVGHGRLPAAPQKPYVHVPTAYLPSIDVSLHDSLDERIFDSLLDVICQPSPTSESRSRAGNDSTSNTHTLALLAGWTCTEVSRRGEEAKGRSAQVPSSEVLLDAERTKDREMLESQSGVPSPPSLYASSRSETSTLDRSVSNCSNFSTASHAMCSSFKSVPCFKTMLNRNLTLKGNAQSTSSLLSCERKDALRHRVSVSYGNDNVQCQANATKRSSGAMSGQDCSSSSSRLSPNPLIRARGVGKPRVLQLLRDARHHLLLRQHAGERYMDDVEYESARPTNLRGTSERTKYRKQRTSLADQWDHESDMSLARLQAHSQWYLTQQVGRHNTRADGLNELMEKQAASFTLAAGPQTKLRWATSASRGA